MEGLGVRDWIIEEEVEVYGSDLSLAFADGYFVKVEFVDDMFGGELLVRLVNFLEEFWLILGIAEEILEVNGGYFLEV